MSKNTHAFLRGAALTGIVLLSAGCSTITHNDTVLTSDTYALWSGRMDHIPFFVHFADGHTEAFDDRGDPWPETVSQRPGYGGGRVEVFVGVTPEPSTSLCENPPAQAPEGANAHERLIVAALCDQMRTVVSFSDRTRADVPRPENGYVAHVRRLLLDGIWASVPEEPDPWP